MPVSSYPAYVFCWSSDKHPVIITGSRHCMFRLYISLRLVLCSCHPKGDTAQTKVRLKINRLQGSYRIWINVPYHKHPFWGGLAMTENLSIGEESHILPLQEGGKFRYTGRGTRNINLRPYQFWDFRWSDECQLMLAAGPTIFIDIYCQVFDS